MRRHLGAPLLGLVLWGSGAMPALSAPQASAPQVASVPAALLDRWVGAFKFSEALPGTAFVYQLFIISSRDGDFVADVVVEGRQTKLLLHCKVLPEAGGKAITLVFAKHSEPPIPAGGWFKPGDRLFTLRQEGAALHTQWLKLKPQLPRRAWGSPGFVRLNHGAP